MHTHLSLSLSSSCRPQREEIFTWNIWWLNPFDRPKWYLTFRTFSRILKCTTNNTDIHQTNRRPPIMMIIVLSLSLCWALKALKFPVLSLPRNILTFSPYNFYEHVPQPPNVRCIINAYSLNTYTNYITLHKWSHTKQIVSLFES